MTSDIGTPPASLVDLGAPADELARLAAAVTDDQLDAPTPCRYPVRTLLAHVLGLAVAFADSAAKVEGPTTMTAPDPTTTPLPTGWREEIAPRLAALAQAWRRPDAWDGMTWAGGVQLPAPVMGLVANDELVLHGWHLARSTGQDFSIAPGNLEAAHQIVAGTPEDPAAREGLFGPVVPVPPDAPLLDRVLGGAGRDPRWAPPARAVGRNRPRAPVRSWDRDHRLGEPRDDPGPTPAGLPRGEPSA